MLSHQPFAGGVVCTALSSPRLALGSTRAARHIVARGRADAPWWHDTAVAAISAADWQLPAVPVVWRGGDLTAVAGCRCCLPQGTYIDKKCPFTGGVSIRGRILKGVVVSTKMNRTIVIRRDYLQFVRKYRRCVLA